MSEFKKKKYVNIREYYYDEDGEMKPGRKGKVVVAVRKHTFIMFMPKRHLVTSIYGQCPHRAISNQGVWSKYLHRAYTVSITC